MTIFSEIHLIQAWAGYCLPRLVILTLLLIPTVQAEVYRWTDSRGIIHFTDNPVRQAESVKTPTKDMDAKERLEAIQGIWQRTGSTPSQQELALKVLSIFDEIPEEYNFPEKVDEHLIITGTKVTLKGTAYSTRLGVGKETLFDAEGWLSLKEGPAGKEGRFNFKRGRNPYMEDFTLMLLLNLLNRQDLKGTDTIRLNLDGDKLSITVTLPASIGITTFTIRYQRLEQ